MTSRPEHSKAFLQHAIKIFDMLEHIVADDRAKTLILERKVLTYPNCETDSAVCAEQVSGSPSNT
jgi:hypothetical protein